MLKVLASSLQGSISALLSTGIIGGQVCRCWGSKLKVFTFAQQVIYLASHLLIPPDVIKWRYHVLCWNYDFGSIFTLYLENRATLSFRFLNELTW